MHPESVEKYRKHVPQLCKILRSLLMSGSSLSGEHDVGGITDPFLQAKVRSDLLLLQGQQPSCIAIVMQYDPGIFPSYNCTGINCGIL